MDEPIKELPLLFMDLKLKQISVRGDKAMMRQAYEDFKERLLEEDGEEEPQTGFQLPSAVSNKTIGGEGNENRS